MKGVCFESVGHVSTNEINEPEILDPRDAIVKVTLAGLCGSDLHPYFGREVGLEPGTVMGHEMVGEIVATGNAAASTLAPGDQVFTAFSTNCGQCFYCELGLTSRCISGQLFGWVENGTGLEGCQSQFVRVPFADATLMKLPNGLSMESALLLGDNFSTGFYCAKMAEVKPGGVYVVIGCGTVGQLCILSAFSQGAEKVFALDPVADRRDAAQRLGAIGLPADESALAEIKSATSGHGADAVMELVGLPAAQELAFRAVRPGGIMSVIGCHCTPNFSFSPVDAYDKNLTYRTGRCPARHYMDELAELAIAHDSELSQFVTHRFNIDDSKEAYDVFSNRREGCIKAVFEM